MSVSFPACADKEEVLTDSILLSALNRLLFMESVLLRQIIFHSMDWQAIIEVSKSRKPCIMTG